MPLHGLAVIFLGLNKTITFVVSLFLRRKHPDASQGVFFLRLSLFLFTEKSRPLRH